MLEAPEEAAVLYVDGHVRVYHGTATNLRATFASSAPAPSAERQQAAARAGGGGMARGDERTAPRLCIARDKR
jgi:hypothetical protein